MINIITNDIIGYNFIHKYILIKIITNDIEYFIITCLSRRKATVTSIK